ncbi:MAG: SMP-30/gluconolactonase/LRE family protein [Acidobacteria bacterium]|nr:SMP-30/gluconolactonase/LRE family protein [Acidobacteriota bacterium]MCW5948394.1 SMP-30/gluconolactonase/LRE family protein [Pyrinomonadaceae bacterium]
MNRIIYGYIFSLFFAFVSFGQGVPSGKPTSAIDLTTTDGVKAVAGQWRYSDTRIVETEFRAPDAAGQPNGRPVRTYDYTPHAGVADFDDSGWEQIAPTDLSKRRGNGRLSFNWYRITITIPETVGGQATAGSTVVFQTTLDDLAEIWVNGELTRYIGQQGGSVAAGWNAPNRLVIGRDVQPGQKIQVAVFGVNGPLSDPPTNFIWVREAKLEFYKGETNGPAAITPSEVNVTVDRRDPALDAIIGYNPKVFKLAEGFKFTEGPVWTADGLLFSDPNANTIYRYSKDGKLSVFRTPSGYSGADIAEYRQPGSNGITLDPEGRTVLNQHGNRRVVRLEADGSETVVADRYDGKRLNSPNDLVYRSDGTLFFTDPNFGLPKFGDDKRKELPYTGVYAVHKGEIRLLTTEFKGPNGIALSPDERYLYIGNWDDDRKVVYRYDLARDGTISNGKLFFDFTSFKGEDAIDGIKVDTAGNLYVSAPGGLQILSPEGKHLGTIVTPQHVHNMAWGDEDGKSLYLCARTGLYRIKLNIAGVRPNPRR